MFHEKNKYHLSPQFLVPNFSRNDTVLHLESLNFGFGSPFGPCFMKNRVLAGSLFLDSRYPVLVTMVLPFSLKIWFRSIFWRWIFCWFIQKFWFIQCKNLNIDSKTYSSNSFSTKNQFKKYSKLSFPKIFNSKKYPFSDFLRNSIQKYYSKLDFFFDSIQKNYSKLDFFSDSIQRNIHSILKKE